MDLINCGFRIAECGINQLRISDCGFWNRRIWDLRCAIWDVRFKTEETGLDDCGIWISARPGANLRITLQHCLQTKTRQMAHYNVNGLGQGLRN